MVAPLRHLEIVLLSDVVDHVAEHAQHVLVGHLIEHLPPLALGLEKTAEYEDKWCEFDTPEGKSIALDTFSPEGTPPYLALETDDIEAELARLKQAGVEVLMDVRDNKVCKMAIIKDSEGNGLMLHQIAPDRAK